MPLCIVAAVQALRGGGCTLRPPLTTPAMLLLCPLGTLEMDLLLKVVFLQQLPAAGVCEGGGGFLAWLEFGLVGIELSRFGSVALVVVSFSLVWFVLVELGWFGWAWIWLNWV